MLGGDKIPLPRMLGRIKTACLSLNVIVAVAAYFLIAWNNYPYDLDDPAFRPALLRFAFSLGSGAVATFLVFHQERQIRQMDDPFDAEDVGIGFIAISYLLLFVYISAGYLGFLEWVEYAKMVAST